MIVFNTIVEVIVTCAIALIPVCIFYAVSLALKGVAEKDGKKKAKYIWKMAFVFAFPFLILLLVLLICGLFYLSVTSF